MSGGSWSCLCSGEVLPVCLPRSLFFHVHGLSCGESLFRVARTLVLGLSSFFSGSIDLTGCCLWCIEWIFCLRISQGRIESIGSVWQAGAFHFEAGTRLSLYGFWTMISLLRLRDYNTLDKEEIGMHYAPNRMNQDAVVMTP
ncbi:hypothetical protein Bca101_024035 [Brassica carinata]